MNDVCEQAVKVHQAEHEQMRGQWIMACGEGWCGCPKDCGRPGCDICPTEGGPA